MAKGVSLRYKLLALRMWMDSVICCNFSAASMSQWNIEWNNNICSTHTYTHRHSHQACDCRATEKKSRHLRECRNYSSRCVLEKKENTGKFLQHPCLLAYLFSFPQMLPHPRNQFVLDARSVTLWSHGVSPLSKETWLFSSLLWNSMKSNTNTNLLFGRVLVSVNTSLRYIYVLNASVVVCVCV